ncbi:MAG: enoyl-ACP reductase [Chloroflexi bacterium]|nr:enoyl-ACP reductase [Chloroflexota bacterium]
MPGLLEGKLGLVAGLSNKYGVAWGVTQALIREGARLAFTYQGRYAEHAHDLTSDIAGSIRVQVDDASDDALLRPAFDEIRRNLGGLDFLVHSIGFSPPAALTGRVTDTTRDDFRTTFDASAYTLLALTRAAEPLFNERGGGSVVAMTYYGGEKVVLGYKIMGVAKAALDGIGRYLAAELGPDNIRVNLLSLGPLRTMAARGIPGFLGMMHEAPNRAPLRRNIGMEDAGNAAVFLCSDLSRNVTGEILHVDAGYNITGM